MSKKTNTGLIIGLVVGGIFLIAIIGILIIGLILLIATSTTKDSSSNKSNIFSPKTEKIEAKEFGMQFEIPKGWKVEYGINDEGRNSYFVSTDEGRGVLQILDVSSISQSVKTIDDFEKLLKFEREEYKRSSEFSGEYGKGIDYSTDETRGFAYIANVKNKNYLCGVSKGKGTASSIIDFDEGKEVCKSIKPL